MPTRPGEPLQSLENGLLVLEELAREAELGISDLARRLGLGKSTVHRVLTTLMAREYAEQDRTSGKYRLGIRTFELGSALLNRMTLNERAMPHLRQLVAEWNETANLAILDGTSVLYLARVETSAALRPDLKVGTRVPAYASALGKAMLAWLPPERRAELRRQVTLVAHTAKTCSTWETLEQSLAEVRAHGYAVDDEEYIPGIRCVGAPVWGHGGAVVGAVSLAGPTVRMSQERLPALAAAVLAAARAITRDMGGPWPGEKSAAAGGGQEGI